MFGPEFLEQMAKMKAATDKGMERLPDLEVDGSAGNGLVRIKMDGNFKIKQFQLACDHKIMELEELEDFISIALNDVVSKVNLLREKELGASITSLL